MSTEMLKEVDLELIRDVPADYLYHASIKDGQSGRCTFSVTFQVLGYYPVSKLPIISALKAL